MAGDQKQPEDDGPAGAPEWMVTFSDCMTLLLTFFVLLLSFSAFEEQLFEKLRVIYSRALTSISPITLEDRDALLELMPLVKREELDQGSEKPTAAQNPVENLRSETRPRQFHNRKVFMISSEKIFLGMGTHFSRRGREILSTMGDFMREVPHRVVISEHSIGSDESRPDLGLNRSWALLEYFSNEKRLDKDLFSIAQSTTVPQVEYEGSNVKDDDRQIEIVLLERSIYN